MGKSAVVVVEGNEIVDVVVIVGRAGGMMRSFVASAASTDSGASSSVAFLEAK
jgi:hypothetical protein